MAEQPGSVRDLFRAMPQYANHEAIQDVSKTIQFNITEDSVETEHYYLDVRDGQVQTHEGTAADPDVTIITPAEVWMDIATGQINGAVAFMTGKFKATGDLTVLMSMQNWFNIPS
jgi:putative sterol carrier protein